MDLSPDDAATIVAALLDLHAGGDDEAGSRIAAMTPEQLAEVLGTETPESLVDKVVTVHGPHGTFQRRQKVSDGGDSADARTPSPHDSLEPGQADHVLGAVHALADDPEVSGKPGLLHRLGDKCLTAVARINLLLVKATPAIHKALSVAADVLDTPDDLRTKFGYNPTLSSGVDHGASNDPMVAHLGISTHFAATVAAKVLSSALTWLKKRGDAKQESEEDADSGSLFAQMLAIVAEELGLPEPDTDAVATAFAATVGA